LKNNPFYQVPSLCMYHADADILQQRSAQYPTGSQMSAIANEADNATTPGQAFIASCVGRTLCVTVTDGRILEGELRCVDNVSPSITLGPCSC
jgi:hypothetical protein